ncbi:hypothetical protein FC756_01680 [Lysinibacillus mangiferihumi]|uniref:Helix-turn-helix domain-containing protein n=1 Tax=Lysinibacillus mangiferihumi TaxID=1130819 RepID=A0A4U2ZD40_9BACI|nr:hypothetical protein FC756_01680 [Lysinibacillus mangiferihumi]
MCIKDICIHLGIARSTYYRWKQAFYSCKFASSNRETYWRTLLCP